MPSSASVGLRRGSFIVRIIYDTFRSVNTKVIVGWFRGRNREPGWQTRCMSRPRRAEMMLTIVFVCLLLWFLGLMTASSLGGVLHVLLVAAIVLFLVHIIQGRSIGNA